MNRVIPMLLLAAAGAVHAADDMAVKVVRLGATMNEVALACKHMSSEEVQKAKEKQKTAAIADMQMSAADYDQLYKASAQEFQTKWQSMSKQQQSAMCEQMKNAPK